MRVYISVDMEGIAGHTGWAMVTPGDPAYAASQRRMTDEASAAVAGAFEGGAESVVVNDAHDGMRNVIPEELDPRADLVSGSPKPASMVEGLDDGCDLALFVGYHGAAGTEGVLAHTYSLDPVRVRVNGDLVGECTLNALVAGAWGVPVGMVSGDDVLAREVERHLPWARSVVVKTAAGRFGAASKSPARSQAAIREAAKAAVRGAQAMKTLSFSAPLTLEVEFRQAGMALVAALLPGAEPSGPTAVRYEAPDPITLHRAFRAMTTLAGAARDG